MFYTYDEEGFYIGESHIEVLRSTSIAPPLGSPGPDREWCFADHLGKWVAAKRPEPVDPSPPNYGYRITKLAFRQRVGPQALAAIELASVHNPAAPVQAQQLAATLRVMLADVQAATFIDLARPDTRAGVQQLEAAGLLPAGKAAEILDTPVQAAEVPVGA